MGFPVYPKKPHATGCARISVNGSSVYLGKFGSPESHIKYAELRKVYEGVKIPPPPKTIRTICELVAAFHNRGLSKYSPHEQHNFKLTLRPLVKFYGKQSIEEFGPIQLLDLRVRMAENIKSRTTLNQRIGRIVRVWKWGAGLGLIPAILWQSLKAVSPIQPGSEAASIGVVDYGDVPPVPEEDLQAVLAETNIVIGSMIRTQLLTGARPGEVCVLRACDIVRDGIAEIEPGFTIPLGRVWAAVFHAQRKDRRTGELIGKQHKTAHRNHHRIVLIGPQCQAILQPFIDTRKPDEYLFSPLESWMLHRRGLSSNGKKRCNPYFSTSAYGHAIKRIADRLEVSPWSPHQLRHNAATLLNQQFGPDVTRIILGHRSLKTTRQYVQESYIDAVQAIQKIG